MINTIYCETASEYLKELSLCNSSWWDDSIRCPWIFRGQNSNCQLLPMLYRKSKENNNQLIYQKIFDQIQHQLVDTNPYLNVVGIVDGMDYVHREKKPILVELIKAAFVEIELTEKFLLRCNEVSLQTPTLQLFPDQHPDLSGAKYFHYRLAGGLIKNFVHNMKQFEIPLRTGFQRLLHFHYPEAMALARHHGVPSKLLDWTKEPLIAGFFSALSNDENNICVWALNKNYFDMTPPKGQVAFYEKLSKNGLAFLHMQRGLFTDLIGLEAYYYLHGKWPTLDEYLFTTLRDPHTDQPIPQEIYLKKIELKSSEKNELLTRLDRMNINKSSLMPTYDNVGQSVIPI